MLEGFLLSNVGVRVLVLLGACIWWEQAEDEMTRLAGLFSMVARGESDPSPLRQIPQGDHVKERHFGEEEPTAKALHFDVPCPWCLSEDTKPKNKAMDIYECSECGEVFARPLS